MLAWLTSALRPWPLRGKRRLLDHLTPRSGVRPARVQGATFALDLAELIQREIYMGTFEPAEARVMARLLRPGDCFVDAGANVGFFTAVAARAVAPGGSVFAYEPSPLARGKLEALAVREGWRHVQIVAAALGDRHGAAELFLGDGAANHTPTLWAHPGATATTIEVRTLDAEAERLGIGRIHMLKIDVEGYEPHVLAGARGLLAAGRIEQVMCEFNAEWLARAGSSEAALEAVLVEAGLRRFQPRGVPASSPNRFYRLASHGA